ncbi:D-lactate dehydrogenase VanH-A, partial [Klebsiella pneumoniae]|nr:D-lactate dehydrogenase VanH-A [Klebsiella pneumoniae]
FARGTLIDSEDLIKALDSGKVAGAALDTYEYETKIFNKDLEGQTIDDKVFMNLFNRDNVLITPHTAFYTETAVHNMV